MRSSCMFPHHHANPIFGFDPSGGTIKIRGFSTGFAMFVFFVVNRRLAARGRLISECALRVEHDLFPILAFAATTT
jgi:hypothetical protein